MNALFTRTNKSNPFLITSKQRKAIWAYHYAYWKWDNNKDNTTEKDLKDLLNEIPKHLQEAVEENEEDTLSLIGCYYDPYDNDHEFQNRLYSEEYLRKIDRYDGL